MSYIKNIDGLQKYSKLVHKMVVDVIKFCCGSVDLSEHDPD